MGAMYIYNLSISEVEAEESVAQGHHELHNEF